MLVSVGCAVVAVLAAQTPAGPDWQTAAGGTRAFEAASVKLATEPRLPSMPLDGGEAKPPGGRFAASFPTAAYIFFAYKLAPFEATAMNDQFRQLPKWANQVYAIDATAGGNPTKDQVRLMMQSLLADRFKLRVHFENRESPVLALSVVNAGRLGPNLRPHSEGPPCPDAFEMPKLFAPIERPKAGLAWPSRCGNTAQVATSDGTWVGSRNTTMELIARDIYASGFAMGEIEKAVVDQTGLEGRFDYMVELPPGMISLMPKPPDPDEPPKGASFLKAVREQLGLKLVPSKGTIKMLVIDHIEQPSQN